MGRGLIAVRGVACGCLAASLLACSPRATPPSAPPPNDSQNLVEPNRTAVHAASQPERAQEPAPASEGTPDPAPEPPAAALRVGAHAGPGPLYDVGTLPSELHVQWPSPPFIAREQQVASVDAFDKAAAMSGTRVVVTASLSDKAVIKGSDIEVTMRDGVEIKRVNIDHGCKRIRIKGGKYGSIFFVLPAEFAPARKARPDWIIEDVIIDGIQANAPETALEVYGKRIAILRSKVHAHLYSVWSGPVEGIRSEDIVVAGNHMDSDGPEATVRLVSVVRSVTVDNVLRNTFKHNYRIHGDTDYAYAARNTLINTGAMFGTMDEDHIKKLWFDDNTFFQTAPDLFNPGCSRIGYMHAEGNKAYTDRHGCFLCPHKPTGWRVDHNALLPYRKPPGN